MKSIIEVIGEVCASTGEAKGMNISYIFGDTEYIRNTLAMYSKSREINDLKFPLIALFTPFNEDRTNRGYFTSAGVSLMIATSTLSKYTNEERMCNSFIPVLRPIYECFLDRLRNNRDIVVQYNGVIPHTYQENYSFGSRGAMDSKNKPLDDLIDAINISNLKINVKNKQCYGTRY